MNSVNSEYAELIKPIEPIILSLAATHTIYGTSGVGEEDLAQIGLIAAWEASRRNTSRPYLVGAAKRAIKNQVIFQFRKKRYPTACLFSLDATIGPEPEGNTFYSFPSTPSLESSPPTLKQSLVHTFGQNYGEVIRKLPNSTQVICAILRTAVEDYSNVEPEKIDQEINYSFFVGQGLRPLIDGNRAIIARTKTAVLDDNCIKPWKTGRVPWGYWKGNAGQKRAKIAMEDFCESRNVRTLEDCAKITAEDLRKAKLSGMMNYVFGGSSYNALKSVFPDLQPLHPRRSALRMTV